jgi:hypothetical protein
MSLANSMLKSEEKILSVISKYDCEGIMSTDCQNGVSGSSNTTSVLSSEKVLLM